MLPSLLGMYQVLRESRSYSFRNMRPVIQWLMGLTVGIGALFV